MELEERKRLAEGVLAEVARLPAAHVRAIGQALNLAGGAAGMFATSFDYAADWAEYEDVDGWLAELKLAYDLDVVARRPDCGELLERLEGAEVQPWVALRGALLEMTAEREAA